MAALLPLLMVLGMDRADVGMSYYGVALVALTVGYGAIGLVWRPDSLEKLLNPQMGRIGSFVLPLFAVGALVTIAGIGLAAVESSEIVVSALGTAAVFYLVATFALRQSMFIYPTAFLMAAAYSVGLTIPDIDAKYYGLLVLPGVAVALAMGLILQGYPGQYRFGRWMVGWATPQRLDPRHLDVFSPMMPFLLIAYAGSIAAQVLSAGEGWIFFGGLTAAAAIYGYSSWRFLSPLWSYAALLVAHGAFLRVLFLLSPDMPVSQVGAYWNTPGVPAGGYRGLGDQSSRHGNKWGFENNGTCPDWLAIGRCLLSASLESGCCYRRFWPHSKRPRASSLVSSTPYRCPLGPPWRANRHWPGPRWVSWLWHLPRASGWPVSI